MGTTRSNPFHNSLVIKPLPVDPDPMSQIDTIVGIEDPQDYTDEQKEALINICDEQMQILTCRIDQKKVMWTQKKVMWTQKKVMFFLW